MKKKIIYILCLLIAFPLLSDAQGRRWMKYKQNILFGVGPTSFLGDLGGGNGIGRSGPIDYNLKSTKAAIFAAYRNNINEMFALRLDLTAGYLSGDDRYTSNPARRGRNLHFRSGFGELTLMGEVFLLRGNQRSVFKPYGARRSVRPNFFSDIDLYVYTGLGGMYFNPKAKYDGRWVELQPLGTEGQGLQGEPDKYNKFTITIPYGFGIQKPIDPYWSIGLETTFRMTFSDYIDDVSTTYYGRDNLRNAKLAAGASEAEADRAAYLSDPNIYYKLSEYEGKTVNYQQIGEKRGNPNDNDYYFTVMVTVTKKIASSTISRKRKRPTSRYTF